MTQDTHAQANAEQVRVLREALAGAELAGEEAEKEEGKSPAAPSPAQVVSPVSPP